MRTELVRLSGRPMLVAKPYARMYGHLGIEILTALALARERGADLCMLRSRRPANPVLFDLDSDEVRIVRPGLFLTSGLHLYWNIGDAREEAQRVAERTFDAFREQAIPEIGAYIHNLNLPSDLRDLLRRTRTFLAGVDPAADGTRGLYFRRRLIRDPVRVFLREELAEPARPLAVELGITPDSRIVCLHAREAGYKRGFEVQDKYRRQGKDLKRDDSLRNVHIESYFEAIDYLVSRGYLVVRIGDRSMTPIRRQGVIDLATSPLNTQALEIYCLLSARFLISTDAGPMAVSYLTNTPVLIVNITDPIAAYPVRSSGLFICKRAYDRSVGRFLSPLEMLQRDHMANVRNSANFRYADNTSEELVCAVTEMLEGLDTGWTESDAQIAFRKRATVAADELAEQVRYVRKWGADDSFLGDGRIARFFAERYM